jgi:HSP20 family protein
MNTQLEKVPSSDPAPAGVTFRQPHYTVEGGKEAFTVNVWMPGVSKNDYTLSIKGDELEITGRKLPPANGQAKIVHREIRPQSYKLSLRLNLEVDAEAVTASASNGILSIVLPVAKAAQARLIEIQ